MDKVILLMLVVLQIYIQDVHPQNTDTNLCEVKAVNANTHYDNLLPESCGFYTPNRILIYNTASLFEYPWMAILRYNKTKKYDNMQVDCTGSLINNRYVLTAAQCVEQNNRPIQVRLGEYHLLDDKDCVEQDSEEKCAPPVQDYGIDCIIRHQNYSSRTKINDIALIRLDRPVTYDDHIRPTCLPVTESLKQHNPPRYIVTGWSYGWSLQKTEVKTVNRSACQKLQQEAEHCADAHDYVEVCYWNTGSPLGMSAQYNGMRFVQFGIVSFAVSEECDPSEPFVYTRMADYMDWVVANLRP